MSISLVLEVAVGLIVVYYILGSVVSLITQWINEFFESRGRALEQYLIKLVGEGFGSCTVTGSCEAVCPKEISLDFIARMNRDYAVALIKGEPKAGKAGGAG